MFCEGDEKLIGSLQCCWCLTFTKSIANLMTLFKYIRPERIDIIHNLEIRFTQPDALNDPFELRPHINSLIAEADVLENLPESPMDLRPMVKQAYELLPELKAIPLDFAMQAVEEFMSTEDARRMMSFISSVKSVTPMVRPFR